MAKWKLFPYTSRVPIELGCCSGTTPAAPLANVVTSTIVFGAYRHTSVGRQAPFRFLSSVIYGEKRIINIEFLCLCVLVNLPVKIIRKSHIFHLWRLKKLLFLWNVFIRRCVYLRPRKNYVSQEVAINSNHSRHHAYSCRDSVTSISYFIDIIKSKF